MIFSSQSTLLNSLSITLALITTLIATLYIYFLHCATYWKKQNVPFIKPVPFVGNILEAFLMRKSISEILQDLYQATTEPFVGFWCLHKPCLLVRDPNLVRQILVSDFSNFRDRTMAENKEVDPIGSYVLFIMRNPDWKTLRNKMTPIFTALKMKNMAHLLKDSCSDMLKYLRQGSGEHDLMDLLQRYNIDNITSCAFGVKAHSFEDEDAAFRKMSRKFFDYDNLYSLLQQRCFFIAPLLVKIFKMRAFDKECIQFLKDMFLKVRQERLNSSTPSTRNDLIDVLIEVKDDYFNDDILVGQALMFFAAGFETTTTAMSFCLFELARQTAIQQKVRDEINDVLKKHGGEINYDSLKDMPYLEMCIKESLRKYPPLAFLDRNTNVDYKIPGTDVVLKKDTPVFISTLGLQMDPQHYPNPEVFDPERFSDANIAKRSDMTFLAFGAGARNCIGGRFAMMTAKMGIVTLLKNFRLDVSERAEKEIKYDGRATLIAPITPLLVKFTEI